MQNFAFMSAPSHGLPALAPQAQHLQNFGRGDDSMLVHMTPNEVNSLQGLAMASGGSLTINPHTGLPEAGWLGKLLPTLIGLGLNMFLPGVGSAIGSALGGIGSAAGTGILVGAGTTAITGDLGKGLSAGLGAYGGASLGGGLQGAFGSGATAPTAAVQQATQQGTGELAKQVAEKAAQKTAEQATQQIAQQGSQAIGQTAAGVAAPAVKTGAAGFFQGFGNTARGVPLTGGTAPTGMLAKSAPMIAGLSALSSINNAFMPEQPKAPEEEKSKYEGPYVPTARNYISPTTSSRERKGSEHTFFDRLNPVPGFEPYKNTMGMAEGGEVANGSTSNGFITGPAPEGSGVGMAGTAGMPRRFGERDYGFVPRGADVPGTTPGAQANLPRGIKGMAMANNAALKNGGLQALKGRGTQPSATAAAPQPSAALARVAAAPITRGRERDHGFRSLGNAAATQAASNRSIPSSISLPFARGGEVPLRDGSFVVDARTVSELGNGSSGAGKELLGRMGGRPVEGPGDGVSDSIPARIGANQPARVARDEVVMPPDAVQRIGRGNAKRGADKLYALMNKAHKARKRAKRGQDTGLRRGLA